MLSFYLCSVYFLLFNYFFHTTADTEMLVACRVPIDNSSAPIDNSSVPITTTPAQTDKDHLQQIGEYCSPELVIILGTFSLSIQLTSLYLVIELYLFICWLLFCFYDQTLLMSSEQFGP